MCIQFHEQLSTLEQLEEWIQTLLWEKQVPGEEQQEAYVLRLKGILVPPKDNPNPEARKRLIIQGVQDLYDIQEGYGDEGEAIDVNKLVLIGKSLHPENLRASFVKYVKVNATIQ